MTRQIRRHADFQVTLQITNDDFVRPPRASQRRWIISRTLDELVANLEHLHRQAARFVAGSEDVTLVDRTQSHLEDHDIMEDWQVPVMEAMARAATRSHGDVLEIGFGRGVSADMIQRFGARSHTIVECNDSIVERFHAWKAGFPDRDIRLIHGKWQDEVDQFGLYDAVFFHTYPLDEDEQQRYVARSVTFAEHFFPTAAAHLRSDGVFTYLTNEIDSLSRAHQRLVFEHFSKMSLEVVGPLTLPEDSRDDLWGDSMVVIEAKK